MPNAPIAARRTAALAVLRGGGGKRGQRSFALQPAEHAHGFEPHTIFACVQRGQRGFQRTRIAQFAQTAKRSLAHERIALRRSTARAKARIQDPSDWTDSARLRRGHLPQDLPALRRAPQPRRCAPMHRAPRRPERERPMMGRCATRRQSVRARLRLRGRRAQGGRCGARRRLWTRGAAGVRRLPDRGSRGRTSAEAKYRS